MIVYLTLAVASSLAPMPTAPLVETARLRPAIRRAPPSMFAVASLPNALVEHRRAPPALAKQSFAPDNYHREAARIVTSLKSNAALLAAFAFSAFTRPELPENVDESLQAAYILLCATTFALELVAVYAGQQLMYAMADGTFGAPREDGSNDPERTILGVLLANHKTQFYIVRTAFLGGIASMMGAIGVRAWASYDPPLAIAVTLVFCGAILAIVASNRDTTRVFERVRLLDERVVSVRESFEEADENGDGLLSVGELQRALARCGADVSAEEVEALLRRCELASGEAPTIDLEGFTQVVRLLRERGLEVEDGCVAIDA